MSAAPELIDRVTLICADCGDVFYVPERDSWKTVCRFCYRGEMKAAKRVEELEAQIAGMLTTGNITIDRRRWRQLLQLCHPDRHDGSASATDCAQWLNQIRDSVDA